jgi:hypothetical protein
MVMVKGKGWYNDTIGKRNQNMEDWLFALLHVALLKYTKIWKINKIHGMEA